MIQIKHFVFSDFQENTYVLYNQNSDCIIIDPGCCLENEKVKLKSFMDTNHLSLQQVLFTHGHLDHAFGARFLAQTYPQVPLRAHKDDELQLKQSKTLGMAMGITMETPPPLTGFISEGEIIKLGEEELKVLHVPGHSPGSVCFYSEKQKFVFAGDVLFAGSIGRCDFPGGNMNTLLAGIRQKLFTLPDDVIVYSGHGPSTTIGYEKQHNPFFQ